MTAPNGTIGAIGMATRTVAVAAIARVRRRLEKTSIYLSWRWLSGGAAPRAISAVSANRWRANHAGSPRHPVQHRESKP